jgi:hypothetical protein
MVKFISGRGLVSGTINSSDAVSLERIALFFMHFRCRPFESHTVE